MVKQQITERLPTHHIKLKKPLSRVIFQGCDNEFRAIIDSEWEM